MGLVQSASNTGASGSTLAVTLGSPTTAGNCLIVCVGSYDNSAPPQVSGVTLGGSAGNFASANTAYNSGVSLAGVAGWIDPNCAGGQTAVAISFTGDSGISPATAAWVMEWSGLLTSPLDTHPAGVANFGSSWSSGSSGTLAQASELAIGLVAIEGSGTLSTPGGAWTELTQAGTAGAVLLGVGYQVVSATTALTYSGTTSASDYYAACIFTLKLLAAAGALPAPQAATTLLRLGRPTPGNWRQVPPAVIPPPPLPAPSQAITLLRRGLAVPQAPPPAPPAACGSTIASPGQLPGNLLSPADSDFETWTGDWAAGSNTIIGQSAATAFCGCESLVMISATAGSVSASSPLLPATALAGYIASGYLFTQAAAATGSITVNFWNSGRSLLSSPSAAAVTLTQGSWTPLTAAQGAPAGTAWVSITFTVTGLAAGQLAFLDLAYAARTPAQVLIAWPTQPASSTPLFCDVTPWVRADKGLKITRGRTDEVSEVQASKLTVTLDNTTGWFTVNNPGSPWYPGVLIGRRTQVNESDQNGAWHTRFDGTLTDLPVTWAGGTALEALTPAAASGVLAKLGRAAGLRTMLEEEILQDSPMVFYTLADAQGSITASDSSGNSAPPLTVKTYGTGGKLAFASGGAIVEAVSLSGTSPLTSVLCTPVVASPGGPLNQQDQQLEGYLPEPVTAAAGFTFEIWTTGIDFAFNPDAATWYAIAVSNPQTGATIGVAVTGGGSSVQPALTLIYSPSIYMYAPAYSESSLSNIYNGFPFVQPGMYAVTVSGTTASLWYNSVAGSPSVQLVASVTIPATFEATYLTVGGPLGGSLGWQGSLNCASVFPAALAPARLQTHYQAGWSAFSSGPPTPYYVYQLISNVARYAGLPSWQLDLPSSGVSAASIYSLSGQGPLAALQTYEQVDGGVLYENAAGQLAYQDRTARYAAQSSTAPVLQLAAGRYEPDLLPSITDQFLVNDATTGTTEVSADGTGTVTSVTAWVRAVNTASINDYGQYPDGTPQSPQTGPYWTGSLFVNPQRVIGTFSLDIVGDAANWIVGTRSQPGPRSPVVTVDLLTQPSLRAAVLGAEIGTMLQLEGLPAQYPGGVRPAFMLIEGVTDTLKWDSQGAEWSVVFNTSPSMQSGAWLAGDTAMGILDLTAVTGRGRDGNSSGQAGAPYPVPTFSGTMNNTGSVGANDMRGITSNLQQALTPPCAAISQQSLAQSISSSFTWTAVQWDTIGFDTGLGFELGALGASTAGYYVVPVAGTWLLMATVSWLSASGATLNVSIATGVSPFTFLVQQTVTGNATGATAQQVSVKASLAAGTQVQVFAGTSVTLTLDNATGGCQFSLLFLGET